MKGLCPQRTLFCCIVVICLIDLCVFLLTINRSKRFAFEQMIQVSTLKLPH